MYISNFTNDYDSITSTNYTDTINESCNMTLSNCANIENKIDINIPTILVTIPCGITFLCLMSLMVYTSTK